MLVLQFYQSKNNKQYMWRSIITFGILFLYGGLRTYCNDWEPYENFFLQISKYGISSAFDINDHMEKGWAMFNYLFSSFRYLVLAQTGIMCFAYGYLTYKYIPSRFSWLVVLLLFLSGDKSIMIWSAMRNTIAIDLLLLSLPFIINKKWKWIVVITLLAMQIHTSALIFIPVAAMIALLGSKAKMNKLELMVWLMILVFLLVLPVDQIASNLLVVTAQEDLLRYQSFILDASRNAGIVVSLSCVLLTVGLLFFLYNYAKTVEEHVIGRLGMIFTYSYLIGALNYRISQYFIFIFILACVYMYKSNMNRSLKNLYLAFVILFFAYGLFVVELHNPYCGFITFNSFI